MQIFLDRTDPVSLVAAIALNEAKTPYEWYAGAVEGMTLGGGASVVCGELEDPGSARIDCASLLELLFPIASGRDALNVAQVRTFTHIGLDLVRQLSLHALGDPELPLSRRLSQIMAGLERTISGPVFAPERFIHVPAESFDGQAMGGIDVVFASIFSIAGSKFRGEFMAADFSKTAAWRDSLRERASVKKACAELLPLTNDGSAMRRERRC